MKAIFLNIFHHLMISKLSDSVCTPDVLGLTYSCAAHTNAKPISGDLPTTKGIRG